MIRPSCDAQPELQMASDVSSVLTRGNDSEKNYLDDEIARLTSLHFKTNLEKKVCVLRSADI